MTEGPIQRGVFVKDVGGPCDQRGEESLIFLHIAKPGDPNLQNCLFVGIAKKYLMLILAFKSD